MGTRLPPDKPTGLCIRVRGLVQGVGFRPTVWRLARDCRLSGEVRNDAEGVLINAWGGPGALDEFTRRLRSEAPPLARIDAIETHTLPLPRPGPGFHIVASEEGEVRTGVVPDAATCPQCLAELRDPVDRRFRYPFTNCTHCGPRLSIVRAIPYDRANTSMAVFPLCPSCAEEYRDPGDRRFHAQPNACPQCGPKVWLEDASGEVISPDGVRDPVEAAQILLQRGAILAIKGIGGFHLACDAGSETAVRRLRQRKHRYHKPFALMAASLGQIERYAHLGDTERRLLQSPAAPIVILPRRYEAPLPPELAPGQNGLGFMLPYSPLHHLLLEGLERPIVLTSGNRSDEPQCIDNVEARERLAGIADYWLLHDRDIVNRLDDSVLRVMAGAPRLLRRARGYAPAPIPLPPGFEQAPPILAMGGELKNTFCLLRDGQAILSQHMGDLEQAPVHADYRTGLALYRDLFDFTPARVAVDLHPDYLSTQWGGELARRWQVPCEPVQHHHAHIAACLAEHGIPPDAPPVLGVVLDGLGYGGDGTLWGGEFLLAGYRDYRRLAHFTPVAMIGGMRAMREPWRNTYAHLSQFLGWAEVARDYPGLSLVHQLAAKPLRNLDLMLQSGLNAPPASSAGRLFDAVAAALGLCTEWASYEGQAAIELEALAEQVTGPVKGYPYRLTDAGVLDWTPLWRELLDDLQSGTPVTVIAARFHQGLAAAVAETAAALCRQQGLKTVVLSGGVFQNRLLLEGVTERLDAALRPLSPQLTPANDGGLALGQSAIVSARTLESAD